MPETAKLTQAFKASTATVVNIPASRIELAHGERFVGTAFDVDGKPIYHLIELPVSEDSFTWQQAKDFTADDGSSMPKKQDGALIKANPNQTIKDGIFWLDEQYGADYAWCQSFSYGNQSFLNKLSKFGAVRVRRLFL